jgi:hypothetical protein
MTYYLYMRSWIFRWSTTIHYLVRWCTHYSLVIRSLCSVRFCRHVIEAWAYALACSFDALNGVVHGMGIISWPWVLKRVRAWDFCCSNVPFSCYRLSTEACSPFPVVSVSNGAGGNLDQWIHGMSTLRCARVQSVCRSANCLGLLACTCMSTTKQPKSLLLRRALGLVDPIVTAPTRE